MASCLVFRDLEEVVEVVGDAQEVAIFQPGDKKMEMAVEEDIDKARREGVI